MDGGLVAEWPADRLGERRYDSAGVASTVMVWHYNSHPAKGNRAMRTTSRRCCWFLSFLLVSAALLSMFFPPRVHADGGAPNLAYISGTPSGVSVIDVQQ